MRILFCTPPYNWHNLADEKIYITEPLQFETLVSAIDPTIKCQIEVLDLRLERRKNTFLNKLRSYKPDVVGFSAWTMHVADVLQLAEMVKQYNKKIYTVVGGHHATIQPRDFAFKVVDFVILGEAYFSFNQLLKSLCEKNNNYTSIPGIAYQENNQFYSNGASVIPLDFNLDTLPFPNRTIISKYLPHYYHLWWKPIAALRTSIGCPARCSFCNLWKVNRGKYLTWGVDYVINYLQTLKEPYIFIVDDHFFGTPQRVYQIGERIFQNQIKKQYCIYSRSDAIAHNPEIVELWANVGLKRVRIGLESFSDKELGNLTKSNSVANNNNAISILKKNNILTEGLFIIGLDYTIKEFQDLANYIQGNQIEIPNITIYTPMPGTQEYEEVFERIIYKNSAFFDFQHAVLKTKLDIEAYCKLYANLLYTVQRPFAEQLRIIGIKHYILRIPAFLRYVYAVSRSFKHYANIVGTKENRISKLLWHENSPVVT